MIGRLGAVVMAAAVFGMGSAAGLAAQDIPLAPDWCNQASDVLFEYTYTSGYSYTQPIGRGEGGVRVIFQPYNQRLVLMRADTREVVRVIEENTTFADIGWLSFSPDCRYLAAETIPVSGFNSTTIWDVSVNPAVTVGSIEAYNIHPNDRTQDIRWSPDSQYALVTSTRALTLWRMHDNAQFVLTREIRSECEAGVVGCNGALISYDTFRWQPENNSIWINFPYPSRYSVTFDLVSGEPLQVAHDRGYVVTGGEESMVLQRLDSTYACRPNVEYRPYNSAIQLENWLTRDLMGTIESGITLAGFQFLGWSASCQYIAAAVDFGDGALQLAIWNVDTGARTLRPISDYVDRAEWAIDSETITVRTDAETFTMSPAA